MKLIFQFIWKLSICATILNIGHWCIKIFIHWSRSSLCFIFLKTLQITILALMRSSHCFHIVKSFNSFIFFSKYALTFALYLFILESFMGFFNVVCLCLPIFFYCASTIFIFTLSSNKFVDSWISFMLY